MRQSGQAIQTADAPRSGAAADATALLQVDSAPTERPVKYLGRQPILDRRGRLFAYELLFRNGRTNEFCPAVDGDQATADVIDNLINVRGIQSVTGGAKAFINITTDMLVGEHWRILPANQCVIELLETIEPTPDVIAACRELKSQGYLLALDDFIYAPRFEPLLDMADIVKVDFSLSDKSERARYARDFGSRGILLLAEKVETHEEHREALHHGYSYVQGYYFFKPEIVEIEDVPVYQRNCLRFLAAINRPSIDYRQVESIAKQEAGLSLRLLRYLNSAYFGFTHRIESIHQALSLLGEKPLRRWASVVAVACLSESSPAELAVASIVRARFCELVGSAAGLDERQLDLFLVGLLSTMEPMTGCPIDELLMEMPIGHDVKAAILGSQNKLGLILKLAVACERAQPDKIEDLAQQLDINPQLARDAHLEAMSSSAEMNPDLGAQASPA